MATKRPKPTARGTNPPSINFKVLARRNIPSRPAKKPKSRLACSLLQRQRRTASGIMAREVESITPETARPYAEARFELERKVKISTKHPAQSSQLRVRI